MTILHLIVHRGNLEKRLELDNIPSEKREELESVLSRINSVIENGNGKDVKELEGFPLYRALELCDKDYSRIVLYGFTRRTCLRVVSNRLSSEGYSVCWDIYGTV